MTNLEHSANRVPIVTVERSRTHVASFPAWPSVGQALGFVPLILVYTVVLPIVSAFKAVTESIARRVTVWK